MIFLITLFILKFNNVESHGRLLNPPARSSCWREFPKNCVTEFNDNQMFCGGKETQWSQNGGKCGICGDNYSGPRTFELGGRGYTGFIVRKYSRGQLIDVLVEITANHLGWFEFRICNADSLFAQGRDADQECLNRNLLKDRFGNSKMYANPGTGSMYTYKLILPSELQCNRCIFQWKYHTGNSWGTDPISGKSCMGCGPQEEFYGCSDISINGKFIGEPLLPVESIPVANLNTNTPIGPTLSTLPALTSIYKPLPTAETLVQIVSNVTFRCPNNGLYPNIKRGCREFFTCWHVGTRWEMVVSMSCPANLLFDNRIKTCNYANTVNCNQDSQLDFMDNIENYKNWLSDLIQELKSEFLKFNLLLTLTIPSHQNLPQNIHQGSKIINNIDIFNLVAYDIHGSWELEIKHPSPLFGNDENNVHNLVQGMLNYGIPASKLVLGMALYGRTFRMRYFDLITTQKLALESGISGKFTKCSGMISYFEICELIRENGWRRLWDPNTKVPFLVNNNEWIGFEDKFSLIKKAKYLKENNLAGVMFWDLTLDDFEGNFCGQGKFPLIKAVKTQLLNQNKKINEKTPRKIKKCPNGDGFFPVLNSNCRQYYSCTYSSTPYESIRYFQCPLNTKFSSSLKICVFDKNLNC